ncbi:MAG: KTSC domain-containing protein [Proteobacteria bacterium]|nr:KTSC domain-containing protein [Pseudomonadota bacterium]
MHNSFHRVAADINLYVYVGTGFIQEAIVDLVSAKGETYNESLADQVLEEALMYRDVLESQIVQEGWADAAAIEFTQSYDISGTIEYEGEDTPLDGGEIAELEQIVEDWLSPFIDEAIDVAGVEELIWIPVDSSNVKAFAYDQDNRFFYVEFLPSGRGAFSEGSVYVYHGVEPEVYSQALQAPSAGKFVWQFLRDRYDYDRLS